MAWIDNLVEMTLQFLEDYRSDMPNGQWVRSLIGPNHTRRGSYFFRQRWLDNYPVGENRTLFHFFINHHAREKHLVCCVRLETAALPETRNPIPNHIRALFAGVQVHKPFGQAPVQDLVSIKIPNAGFDAYVIEQKFPNQLWQRISHDFSANKLVIQFLRQP